MNLVIGVIGISSKSGCPSTVSCRDVGSICRTGRENAPGLEIDTDLLSRGQLAPSYAENGTDHPGGCSTLDPCGQPVYCKRIREIMLPSARLPHVVAVVSIPPLSESPSHVTMLVPNLRHCLRCRAIRLS